MPSQVAAPILTEKMQTFVREYLIDLNATAAAIRTGYSKKTAHAIGWEMLRKPAVAAEVSRCRGELMNKLEVTAERVVAELASLAFSDIREIFTPEGALKPMTEWSPGAAAAVSSLEIEELFEGRGDARVPIGQSKKLKLWSKVDALQLLARHLGIVKERDPGPTQRAVLMIVDGPKAAAEVMQRLGFDEPGSAATIIDAGKDSPAGPDGSHGLARPMGLRGDTGPA